MYNTNTKTDMKNCSNNRTKSDEHKRKQLTHQEQLSGCTDAVQSAGDVDRATMLRVCDAGVRKLYRGASPLHHLLEVEATLTNDQSMMLRRYVHRDVHYHRLHTHTQSFNGLFSMTTQVGRCWKDKPF